jgi:hypothetical protein
MGNLCHECLGHCCHNVVLTLTPGEAEAIRNAGTQMKEVPPPTYVETLIELKNLMGDLLITAAMNVDYVAGERDYLVTGDCGFLQPSSRLASLF